MAPPVVAEQPTLAIIRELFLNTLAPLHLLEHEQQGNEMILPLGS